MALIVRSLSIHCNDNEQTKYLKGNELWHVLRILLDGLESLDANGEKVSHILNLFISTC